MVLHGAFLMTKKPQDDVKRPQHSTKLGEKKTFFSASDPGGGGGRGVGRCPGFFFLCALGYINSIPGH